MNRLLNLSEQNFKHSKDRLSKVEPIPVSLARLSATTFNCELSRILCCFEKFTCEETTMSKSIFHCAVSQESEQHGQGYESNGEAQIALVIEIEENKCTS
jgi:hypothetical protein